MTSGGWTCGVEQQGVGSLTFESRGLKVGPPWRGLALTCHVEFGSLVGTPGPPVFLKTTSCSETITIIHLDCLWF